MTPKELALRKTVPVIFNSFNQPTYLRNLIDRLSSEGFRNLYVLDQASSNPDLLNYYRGGASDSGCTILYLGKNMGPHYFYLAKLYEMFEGYPVIYTDPDVYIDKLAPDFLTKLFALSEKYKAFKVGPALEIPSSDEIADLKFKNVDREYTIAEWEGRMWLNELESGVYDSAVDTTFHLFQPKYFTGGTHIGGLRVAGEGFTFKHMPWYKNNGVPQGELDLYKKLSAHSTWK